MPRSRSDAETDAFFDTARSLADDHPAASLLLATIEVSDKGKPVKIETESTAISAIELLYLAENLLARARLSLRHDPEPAAISLLAEKRRRR